MFKIPIAVPHPHFDNTMMHNRQEVKRDAMQNVHNSKVHDYQKIQNDNWHAKRRSITNYHEYQDYLAINQYLNLKQHIEYGNYKYSITLGNNLDVYV